MFSPLQSLRPLARPLFVAAAGGASSLLTGLVAYWKLDETSGTRSDSVGSNHLTLAGTNAYAAGKLGNAVSLDGGTALSIADNADVSIGSDTDFTWSAWVYLTSAPGIYNGIVNKATPDSPGAAQDHEYALGMLSGHFKIDVGNGSTGASLTSAGTVSQNTWYHLLFWHDSTANTINLQTNGGTAESTSWSGGTKNGTGTLRFGYSLPSYLWNGRIDEVGFWKRVLTSAERASLYNSGSGITHPF